MILTIVACAVYFWFAVICCQIQQVRYGNASDDAILAFWALMAGVCWPVSVLVWTGRAVGTWITE